jgi:putative thioredoxin
MLEKLAEEYGGRFKLAKVNSDENQEIAAAYGIRSIPDVFAFRDGKPVSHFLGAQPESQVRAFVEKLLPSAAELERRRAAELREAGDLAGAVAALRKSLALDPRDGMARIELAEALLDGGRLDEAETEISAAQPDVELDARIEAVRAAIGFARSGSTASSESDYRAKLEADPADHATRFALASVLAARRRFGPALDELLEIVRRDKGWNDGAARKQILAIFTLAEDQPELVSEYRRKLASALY